VNKSTIKAIIPKKGSKSGRGMLIHDDPVDIDIFNKPIEHSSIENVDPFRA